MIQTGNYSLSWLGTRLLPLTSVLPKELLPINGKPGLEYILEEGSKRWYQRIYFHYF
jgi:UTP--glucose-1-phosphate uridylyltransferase